MLLGNVDVKEKIFPNRPSPVFIGETPCVLIYFNEEANKILTGDKYNAKDYQRDFKVNIDILTTECINPEEAINTNEDTEDLLDFLGEQVENTIAADWTLSKMLKGYKPNNLNSEYLSLGISHEGTSAYNIDVDAEQRIAALSLTFSVPYITPAYAEKKPVTFTQYKADFYEVENGQVKDNILLSAEGDL